MGTSYNSSIMTDGLILCVDAANPRSYSGSGTDINDISTQSNILSIYDSAGYISSDKIFRFEYQASGTATNWIRCDSFSGLSSPITNFTSCGFFKVTNAGSNKCWTFDDFDSDTTNRLNFYLTSTGCSYEINNAVGYTSPTFTNSYNHLNVWAFYCYTVSNSGLTHTFYRWLPFLNAMESTTVTNASITGTVGTSFIVGRRGAATGNTCGMDMGHFMMYSRTLGIDEITQNFNALRGRYGI